MKKSLYFIVCAALLLVIGSCQKLTTEGLTRTTYYPIITLQGDDPLLVPVGSAYNDPGVTATEGGEDVTSKVVVGGDKIDPNKIGLYSVTYSATNVDGFDASISRTVIVFDPSVTVSIAGSYHADMDRTTYGTAGRTFAQYAASYGNTDKCTDITFTEIAPGFFYCNDIFAGWYHQIRAYAAKYCMTGYIALNKDNTLTLLDSYVSGWGDGLDYLRNGVYNPETGEISYNISYAGQIFMAPVLIKD